MSDDPTKPPNWFDRGGRSYAAFRPEYPPVLSRFLAEISPNRTMAVDVGCGNGQLTRQLAAYFSSVLGVDPSSDQIANAVQDGRVEYQCAPAEKLPLAERSVDLVTAAQAAHWFDLPAFYAEVRRVAAEGAVIALVSYGVLRVAGDGLQQRFDRFYRDEIGPYWPAERKLVDTGYAGIDFPFDERPWPKMTIERSWTLGEFLGYISTWSAVRRVQEAGRDELLHDFARDITAMWGDATAQRAVSWPINMRLGTIRCRAGSW